MQTVIPATSTRNKILIKALIISALILLLLVPTAFVKSLIEERESRQQDAIAEVSSKWAGIQNVTGPFIIIPYLDSRVDTAGKRSTKHVAYFLPDELTVDSKIIPQERSRGIYKVMLYSSQNNIKGRFSKLNLNLLKIEAQNILWDEASVQFDIHDPKGLNDELKFKWNDTSIILSPRSSGEGMAAGLKLDSIKDLENISFSANISLNGSGKLFFSPVGKTTAVTISSAYPHPSFSGNILPQQPVVNEKGFTATWKSLSHTRTFPQQWIDKSYDLDLPDYEVYNSSSRVYDVVTSPVANSRGSEQMIGASAFGVDLYIPVNGYQKALRSIKYAALCIMLTFCAFFLIETVHKKSVHPFQYGLVGLALVMFYVLLLSISEYIGFNPAYFIAAAATISLIGWFVKGILQSGRLTLILSVILTLLYCYVFIILQLQDYALLLGSIGLFISLGVVMYFSRKFQW